MGDHFGYKYIGTEEPVLKDHPTRHKKVVSRQVVFGGRLNYQGTLKYLVFQDRWSIMTGSLKTGFSV